MTDCCTKYLEEAKWVSRATWVCPACGEDVSLMYFLYRQAVDPVTVDSIKE